MYVLVDCCDGSDEYKQHAKCEDTCLADGAAHRAANAEAIRIAEAGARAKVILATAAQSVCNMNDATPHFVVML